MNSRHSIFLISFFAVIAFFLLSCTPTGTSENQQDTDSSAYVEKQAMNKAKEIFYSLPSPIETAASLDNLGIKFTSDFLNPSSNVDKYSTTNQQALNLGIYTADLSFCALYEQNHIVVDYLTAVKKLTDQLGIVGFFSDSTMQSIQANMNDKSKVVNYISDSYSRSTTFLEEQQRNEIAAIVLVGGWTESLYLAVNLLKGYDGDYSNYMDLIEYQKYTLDDLLGMLQLFSDDNYLNQLSLKLKVLQESFAKINGTITDEQLDELQKNSNELRSSFIQ